MARSATPECLRRPRGRAALLLCTAVLAADAIPGEAPPEALSQATGSDGPAEPFPGITANGQPVFGLFPVEPTGVPTTPVVAAAREFFGALSDAQQQRARFPVDDPEWRKWNPHDAPREGVGLAEMSVAARGAALKLLEVSLSPRGFELARHLMSAEAGAGSATSRSGYRIAVAGEPSASEPWGWQLEGDDLVINYFVLGDQVVMSPLFLGFEAGSAGAAALLEQGRAMLQSLSEAQRQMARTDTAGESAGIIAGTSGDNAVLENVGIPASLMDGEQRARLLELIELYVGNLREGHAAVKMAEVERHLDDTYFAWAGKDGAACYRIFSPVILIELEQQEQPARIHAVMRTPNGNDYGMALLAQHLARHPDD